MRCKIVLAAVFVGAALVFLVTAINWSRKVHCAQELTISQQTSEVHQQFSFWLGKGFAVAKHPLTG